MKKALKSEVAALRVGQSCKYIVHLLETADKQTAGYSIVMEFAERGSLAAVLRRSQEQMAKHLKAKRIKGSGAGAREGGVDGKRVKVRPADMAGAFVGLEEQHVRRIFRQLIEAVAHMHRHNYVHRDIKIENM